MCLPLGLLSAIVLIEASQFGKVNPLIGRDCAELGAPLLPSPIHKTLELLNLTLEVAGQRSAVVKIREVITKVRHDPTGGWSVVPLVLHGLFALDCELPSF